jgi:TIR domain
MKWGEGAVPHGHAFISYVREDKRRVDRLEKFLAENGVPVWRDIHQLWPGEDWRAKIRDAIAADSLAFVACFSTNSEERQKSYQRDELLIAIEQLRLRAADHPYLLPVRFDDCEIPDLDIGAGRTLHALQWVDLFGKQWQENADALVKGVEHILRPEPASRRARRRATTRSSGIPATGDGQRDRARFSRRLPGPQWLTAILASLVAIVLAAGVAFWLSGRGSVSKLPPAPPGVRVTDNTGAISVVLPKSWGDVIGDGWHPRFPGLFNGTLIGPGLNAAPNVGKWFNDLTTPGVFVGASKLLVTEHYNPKSILSAMATNCDFASRQPAASHGLTGYREMWTCPKSTTRWETVALWPRSHSFIAFIDLKIVTPADQASGNRALTSLSVRY